MTLKTPIAFFLAFLLTGQPGTFAASTPIELRWQELNAAINGHSIELTLPGAIAIKGEVVAVRDDGLVLDIKKTSDAKTFPKGNALIPRGSVTVLKLVKHGSNWRTTGTILGVLGGVVIGGYVAGRTATSAGPGIAIFIATASAVTVAGRAAGGAADRSTRTIRIVH